MIIFEIWHSYYDHKRPWRWKAIYPNGSIAGISNVVVSRYYKKSDCIRGINRFMKALCVSRKNYKIVAEDAKEPPTGLDRL